MTQAMPVESPVALPLFYRDPAPLSSAVHVDWALIEGDYSFAAATPYVPIVAGEIVSASRCYPVVFAQGDAQSIAVTGIEQSNLFVEEGRWNEEAYVPAYVRRYPFGFIPTVNPDGFALAIDAGSDRVLRDGAKTHVQGIALFEDGQPSALTRQALDFCDAFQAEALATRIFAEALRAQDLLIEQQADITLSDGEKRAIQGFLIVDAQKFAALSDVVVLEWHRKGWLALIQFHLASLQRFPALLARRERRGDVAKQRVLPESQSAALASGKSDIEKD